MIDPQDFQTRLLGWYDANARDLPWRRDADPYRVLISEMMLQQTRVDTVIPYYTRFLQEFPDFGSLAAADEDRLLKVWQGLGYYSRARNLKKAAIRVISDFGGALPDNVAGLRKLPGVGPYSASAVASIAFGKQEVLVDGNVLRVIARIYAIPDDIRLPGTQERIRAILETLVPAARPGDFNQALMEIGAIRCLPAGKPLCADCPFDPFCEARLNGSTDRIPFRSPAAKREIRNYTVLVLEESGRVALEKRPPEGLLASLWGFPMMDGSLAAEEVKARLGLKGYRVLSIQDLGRRKQVYTHLEWHMHGYHALVAAPAGEAAYRWATPGEILRDHALPKAFTMYFTGVWPEDPETPDMSG
jgi:A/G-specific adenine glycosylase